MGKLIVETQERISSAIINVNWMRGQAGIPAAGMAILRDASGHLGSAWELLQEYRNTDGRGSADRQPPEISRRSKAAARILQRVSDLNAEGRQPSADVAIGPTVRDKGYGYDVIQRLVDCGWLDDLRSDSGTRSLEITPSGSYALRLYRVKGVIDN